MHSTELELLYETSPAGLCFIDTELRYRRINRKLAEIDGHSPEAHLGHTVREMVPEIAEIIEPVLRRVIETRAPVLNFEVQGKSSTHPGEVAFWEAAYHPLLDANGKLLGVNCVVMDVTERKRGEARLRESSERFRFLAESMPLLIWTATATGELDFFNQELVRYTGLPREELVGWGWTRTIHPDDLEANLQTWKQCLETGSPYKFEHRMRRWDGAYRWYICRAHPMHDEQGRIIAWMGSNTDIDDLKRGDEAHARLAAIVDSSDDAILSEDFDGIVTSWNGGAERLLGHAAEEIIGQSINLVIPPELREEEKALFERIRRGETVGHVQTVRLAKDGRKIDVALTLSPIRDAYGKIIGTSSITRDITETKVVEAALRESEERFRSLADNIAPLAWMADADGSIFFYNQRWYDYTGTTFEEMQGWGWDKVHDPHHLPRVIKKWRDSLQKGEAWEDTFPLRGKDGKYRWFLSRAFPIRESDGRITRWFGTNTDITELRGVQEALQWAQQELREHADNLEKTVAERTQQLHAIISELEAFSYSLSHDMRAPLRAIRNFSQIVLQESEDKLDENSKGYLGRVIRSAERLDRLITDVLVFSRVSQDKIELKPVAVGALLEQIIHERPEFQAPRAEICIEGPLPAILGHEASLTQCLTNLLGNAVKFVPTGVVPQVRIWAETVDHQSRIWFEDNGIGIEPLDLGKLFHIFQRLHPSAPYDGTGIGLAIVRKAVERMNGRVGVESTPGKGSRFWIQLPKA